MKPSRNAKRNLLLESLETRTLLAAGDPFGLVADFDLAMRAVSGTGDFDANFGLNFGNRQLVLTGSSDSNVTIDLNLLPSFITNLKISSFDDVTIVGTREIENLVLKDIGTTTAPGLRVSQSLHAYDVSSLTLASTGRIAVFDGTEMELAARSVDDTEIYSDLQSFTLWSESKVVLFVSLNDKQEVNLKYLPEIFALSGVPRTSVHVVLPPVDGAIPGTDTSAPGTDTPTVDTPTTDTPTTDTPTVDTPAAGTPTTDTSAPGNSTPDNSTTPTADHLVIISLPADERTRAFLAELRELLRHPDADTQQLVLDFLNRTDPAHGRSVSPVLTEASRFSFENVDIAAKADRLFDALDADYIAGSKTSRAISEFGLGVEALNLARESSDSLAIGLPYGLFPSNVVEVDVSWPIEIIPSAGKLADQYGRIEGDEEESEPITFEDSVRAIGSCIVERVTAEFSPGQQSIVLLVDPKPSRPLGNARKAVQGLSLGAQPALVSHLPVVA